MTNEKQNTTIYKYDKDIIKEFVKSTVNMWEFINIKESGTSLNEKQAKIILEKLKDSIYIIYPNPSNRDLKFIVLELSEKENIFCEFNNSKEIQRRFKKQYKKINQQFYNIFPYHRFIKNLDVYKEIELTSRNILLNDGTIYNFDDMEFKNYCYNIPSQISKLNYNPLSEKDKNILDKCFNIMYDDKKTMEQYYYYILCNLNKDYATQTIFLIMDKSKVGKTSKILSFVYMRINNILQSRMLEKSEIYNIAYKNSVIYNETQSEKIDGSQLSLLADNTPLEVTRKGLDSLYIDTDDKPLLQLMAESFPFIKSLNNGTARRFLLVPRVSNGFIEFKDKTENANIINQFYYLLNTKEKATSIIEYYIKQIKEKKIISKYEIIKKDMTVSIKDLENLSEDKENIFSKYFILNPIGKYEECYNTRYLITKETLSYLLEFIDYNIITVSHFTNDRLRCKFIRDIIKDNTGVRSVKELGIKNKRIGNNQINFFYAYSLTKEGLKLLKELHKKEGNSEKYPFIELQEYEN